MNESIKLSKELIEFISNSPSCFHVTANLVNMLTEAGFARLSERCQWNIAPGGAYFVTRNDSSVIAFRIPAKTPDHFQIVAAHSDSPTFKIKDNAEVEIDGKYVRLNTEKYGGMIMGPWFDRALSIAGRVIVKNGNSFATKLVNIDRDLLMIPSLAIHMNRNCNENCTYNANKDMFPLYGLSAAKGSLAKTVAEACNVDASDIISQDLFLYNRQAGTIWGADNEFMSAPKLDDLQCAFSAVKAIVSAADTDSDVINMCCIFDNEEVGSTTKQGADSTFMDEVMNRIAESLSLSREALLQMISGSFMVSADNAHAVHPNYPEMADATNRPVLNGGVVVKFNANQKYTTDAVSMAVFKDICNKAEIPMQIYANRSDIPGGSTLGNIANAHVSMNTIDIGAPQLAMHSPYETTGVNDTLSMFNAMKAFYESNIHVNADNTITNL